MEGPVHMRGRGLKINGAARGSHSKNKQWIAGQGTITPHSREGSTHHNDSDRWERGGGVRRGRGRGRGSAQPSPHLSAPVIHEEATSGAEDEGQDGVEADGMEDEGMADEPEDKDLENPEDREKFYQELVKARDIERKHAIAEGKMDDPNVPKRLEDAITMVGTCMDMCPRFERYRRERENNLDRWETIPGTKRVDHRHAVKIYERAAGDKVLPSDLRPPEVLKKTLDYLFHDLIPRGGFAETYDFIRDRSRAVRNDFTIQHETGQLAIECHARCARFHILVLHLLRDKAAFSKDMELQQLMYTLQSLKEFFQDQRGSYSSPLELEMRVYHRLIHIRDQKERHDDIPEEISSHPVFTLTTKFRQCVQNKSAPITKTSTLKVDAEGMLIFGELASVLREQNNVVMIYLVACIIEVLFGTGTVDGIEDVRGELTLSEIIDGISRPLAVTEASQPAPPPQQFTTSPEIQPFGATPLPAPTSVFGQPTVQQPTPPVQPQQSAFSNLTGSNPFGGPVSVFGGPTFGAPALSSVFGTAPKSVFGNVQFPPPAPQPTSSWSASNTPPVAEAKPALSISTTTSSQAFPPQSVQPLFTAPSGGVNGTANHAAAVATPPQRTTVPPPSTVPSTSLNPTAPTFTPSLIFSAPIVPPAIPHPTTQASPAPPIAQPISLPPLSTNLFNTNIFSAAAPETATAPSSPTVPSSLTAEQPTSVTPQRIVERSATLWDFPGLPSQDDHGTPPAKGLVTPTSASPFNPPASASPLAPPPTKVKNMPLPSTPTARWFDPSSLPKRGESLLSLRKQSLLHLQMPDQPSPAEILSPLALPSPRIQRGPPGQEESPTPKNNTAPEPVASSSKTLLLESPRAIPAASPKGKRKQKQKEAPPDLDAIATSFLRRGYIAKKYFHAWEKKTTDRAAYEEACQRGDEYKEKVQRARLSSSLSSAINGAHQDSKHKRRESDVAAVSTPTKKRTRPRASAEYCLGLSDEALAQRLKENHEEHERRWTRASFLQTIRARVVTDAPDNVYPTQWRVWLSTNAESDGTAIWLEHKFDVPDAGEWASEKVFSIPVVPKSRKPPSPGSPGLIVFERTPLEGLEDDIEKKYRVLDDCARLRDVLDSYRALPKQRFTPCLLLVVWADGTGSDVTPDFDDMVKKLVDEGVIATAKSLVISSTATNLDGKFEDAVSLLPLDFEDKATLTTSWEGLTDIFVAPFKSHASDWLDSCWVNETETLDWSRYGEVVRSIEDVQTTLVRELLGLLNVPYNGRVEMPAHLHDHAHLGEASATLDAIVDASMHHIEEALGRKPSAAYALPRDRVETVRARFDGALESATERLRILAAASLASRSAQKRRAEDDENDLTTSPSSAKRRKASPSLTDVSFISIDEVSGDLFDVPPVSKTASIATVSEVAQKPVTVAMLRALAQGILKSTA